MATDYRKTKATAVLILQLVAGNPWKSVQSVATFCVL